MKQHSSCTKNFLLFALVSLCFLSTDTPSFGSARSTIELLEQSRLSIVSVAARTFQEKELRVFSQEKLGAGVLLDKQGFVATSTHIIHGAQNIIVTLPDATQHAAQIAFISTDSDFSILKIHPPSHVYPVEIATKTPSLGESIFSIGHSDILKGTISEGTISGLGSKSTPAGAQIELIRINIDHYSGDSGSSVFNRQAQLIGLISSKRLSTGKEVFVIPAEKILNALSGITQLAQ